MLQFIHLGINNWMDKVNKVGTSIPIRNWNISVNLRLTQKCVIELKRNSYPIIYTTHSRKPNKLRRLVIFM